MATPAQLEKWFAEWMDEVDSALEDECGMTSEDLPDVDYWSLWDRGYSPRRMASYVIMNAGGY